jgi:hypothetical protein
MTNAIFRQLLEQAIFDYEQCTEDEERSSVVQKLIDDLQNPDAIK